MLNIHCLVLQLAAEINMKVWFYFDDILVFCVSLPFYLCDLRRILLNMFLSLPLQDMVMLILDTLCWSFAVLQATFLPNVTVK